MRITRTLATAAASLLVLQGCSGREPARGTEAAAPAVSTSGMVSSAHPLATGAGLEILAKGGNAFDAAVAVAAALNVVEPMMSGAGGYGTIMVYHRGTDRARFLNSSDRIPRTVDSDVYRPPTPGWEQNRRGAKAVSTPANVRAWEAMSSEYGTLPWAELMGPAVRLARVGFELNEETAALLGDAFDEFPDHAKSFYGSGGRPLRAGERLIQADLAASLGRIASEGAGVLHGGPLGAAIAEEMRTRGGFLSLDDLAQAKAEWYEPIGIDYRDVRVLTAPPPANSFPALVRLGTRIMAPGTGIWLNNSLAYSTFEPAGNPMDAFPGRHKLSGDVPVLLVRDGRVWAALGTPGGHTIAQTVPQMVMNLVDFGMDIQAALSAPRISFVEPDVIIVERGIPESVMDGLRSRGHSIRAVGGVGNAHGVVVEYGPDGRPVRFFGGSDPRGQGLAAGPGGAGR